MKQQTRFILIATPILLVGVPMLGLMASVPGLLICSWLIAMLGAKLASWKYHKHFWPAGLLCGLLPAALYGGLVTAYIWALNEVTSITGSPYDAFYLGVAELLWLFALNAGLAMTGLLGGLLFWHHAFAPPAHPVSQLASPAALD